MSTNLVDNEQADYVDPGTGRNTESDTELIREIREDYAYFLDFWRDIRTEGAKDMDFVAGDPWPAADRQDRQAQGRPALTTDELSQYLKQANNTLRQNKRSIQVNPKGAGATDEDAERREALIRGIQYASNAQAAYQTGFEQCTESSWGAWRIVTDYINEETEEVEPRIKRIPNQFTVLFDPNAREADRSDQNKCFVIDSIPKKDFAERWPDAKKKSFLPADVAEAPQWFQGDNIVIAEYWRRKKVKGQKVGKRQKYEYKVVQYITNGMEILEENEWPGSWIPIIGVFGEEGYTNKGGKSQLFMLSMIRRARDPQMMINYMASQQAEEAGLSPKAAFTGYEGEFSGADADAWKNYNKVPRSALTVAMPSWWKESWGPPPLPQRVPFVPNFQGYEIAMEGWRRKVQSAVGQTPLPTSAQRQNEKSGVALEKIQTAIAIGNFNFTDNFDRSLMNTGRQLNELITKVMDTPRYVSTRGKDDSHSLMYVLQTTHSNDPELIQKLAEQDMDYLITDRGEFDVTISVGPDNDSQRAEASDFVTTLVSNLGQIPPPGSPQAKILAKAVRLKSLGPIGDEIADVLDPESDQEIPPQAQAAIGKLQQENQALNAYAQQVEQQKQQLEFEKKAEMLKYQQEFSLQKLKLEAQVATAEINTKAQDESERKAFVNDIARQVLDTISKQQLQAGQQGHEAAMTAINQQHESQMSDQQHQQALEQQDQAGQQAMVQQQLAAEQAQNQPQE